MVDRIVHPYALAMIEAAVDARRVGLQSPVAAALLTETMHGYLPPLDRMTDPAAWPGRALTDATVLLPGAVSPVQTVDGRSAGSPTGFVLADFLVQHVSRVRRTVYSPHSLWNALVSHLVEAGDIRRVAAQRPGADALPVQRAAPATADRGRRRIVRHRTDRHPLQS
jgi:hypothetical protein